MKIGYELCVGLLVMTILANATGCSGASDGATSDQNLEARVATDESELASNGLTGKQAATVLELIDGICGDTWCEGDHNFRFDQIHCTRPCGTTPGTCRLAFRLFPYDSDLETGPTYARTCKTAGFTGFPSLVETASNGYQSLNWDFYDALSACIGKVEEELPPI